MKNKSSGAELLELARRTLRGQLLEHITPQQKYLGLMVANAMAIVARQIELGESTEDEEETRRLCQDIRTGNVAPGSPDYDTVYQSLREQARKNVLISNPGYLDQ